MARKQSRSVSNRRGRAKKQSSPIVKIVMIALGVLVLAGVGWGVYKIMAPQSYSFKRADLDQYVKQSEAPHLLDDGAAVYVDMSDGMNFAYASSESKVLLQAVINKLAGTDAIKFFGMADSKITPLELSHTQLYNHILNPASYDKQKAPIEETLKLIVKNNQPAVMLTDFEEYKGGLILHAAYAKEYFIEWLAKGNNIIFYRWPFMENGKEKLMFIAVFDDNANRLAALIANAIDLSGSAVERFVLGGHDFAYPIATEYISPKDGGNYHDADGNDGVTNVIAGGGPEDYHSYTQPFASATGKRNHFAPLDITVGTMAEYYPVGVSWAAALKNARSLQDDNIPQEIRYNHLLSHLYVDFGAQNGYTVEAVEVRTFDMQDAMQAIAEGNNPDTPKEVSLFLTADMSSASGLAAGWEEISVDFHEKFTGKFLGDIPSTNLIRANIVVSKATGNTGEAQTFFSWPGNPSLAESVKLTIAASSSSPVGRILYTYYLRSMTE